MRAAIRVLQPAARHGPTSGVPGPAGDPCPKRELDGTPPQLPGGHRDEDGSHLTRDRPVPHMRLGIARAPRLPPEPPFRRRPRRLASARPRRAVRDRSPESRGSTVARTIVPPSRPTRPRRHSRLNLDRPKSHCKVRCQSPTDRVRHQPPRRTPRRRGRSLLRRAPPRSSQGTSMIR